MVVLNDSNCELLPHEIAFCFVYSVSHMWAYILYLQSDALYL